MREVIQEIKANITILFIGFILFGLDRLRDVDTFYRCIMDILMIIFIIGFLLNMISLFVELLEYIKIDKANKNLKEKEDSRFIHMNLR